MIHGTILSSAFLFAAFCTPVGLAAEAKYRFIDGRCVDASGTAGLNLGIVGECGDLRGMDLSGKILDTLSLRGSDLSGAKLEGASFVGSDFESAKLIAVKATGTIFAAARMVQTDLADAVLERANLSHADLTESIFKRARLRQAQLSSTSGYEADFSAADLSGVAATDADFSYGTFAGAALDGADFSGAHLVQTSFTDTRGDAAVFDRAALDQTDFTKARLTNSTWRRVVCEECVFEDADLTGANFFRSRFREVIFENAILDQASFVMSSVEESNLLGASFRGTDFRAALLQAEGWPTDRMQGAIINRDTRHSFSADELKAREIVLSDLGAGVGTYFTDAGLDTNMRLERFEGDLLNERAVGLPSLELALPRVDTFIIPYDDGDGGFSDAEITQLRNFVQAGGRVVVLFDFKKTADRILGTDLKSANTREGSILDPKAAAAMGLKHAPTELGETNYESKEVNSADLPKNACVIYRSPESHEAQLFSAPFGKGEIWWIGYSYGGGVRVPDEWDFLLRSILTAGTASSECPSPKASAPAKPVTVSQ